MTIKEVIKHCDEQSSGGFNGYDQLTAWLKELVKLREDQSKYEKALHLATADSLVFDLGQTDEAREQMVSNVVRDYKRRAGIKE